MHKTALTRDHEHDKNSHNEPAEPVDQAAQRESLHAADQAAETVVKGVRKHCEPIARGYGNDLDQHILVQSGYGQANPGKGGKEGMLPGDNDVTDKNQLPETGPAAIQIPMLINVKHVLGRCKAQALQWPRR